MTRLAFAAAAAAFLCAAPALAQTGPGPAAGQPAPASAQRGEAAIRANIEQFRKGAPDLSGMSAALAQAVGPQSSAIQGILQKLGAVSAVQFLGQDEAGAQGFRVVFEHGVTEWVIHFDQGGKIDGLAFRPEQGAAPGAPQG